MAQEKLDAFMQEKVADFSKLTEQDSSAVLSRIATTTELSDLADSDLVVEAIFENDFVPEKWKNYRNKSPPLLQGCRKWAGNSN